MSPCTQLVHLREHRAAFSEVVFVMHQGQRFDVHLLASTEPHGVDECLTNGV